MRWVKPEGEKLTHAQLRRRAETYRRLAASLFSWQESDEFSERLESRFANLAVQYQERADRFLVVQPPLARPIRL
jgi:hypothetical protein